MAKVRLTQSFVDNLPPISEGKNKIEWCDTSLPGLLLEQRATNLEWASFRLRYKNENGRTSYISIGRSCDIDLAEARQKAKKLKAQIQLGADPQAEVRERRKGLTWNQFFKEHYLPYAKQHLRSWRNLENMHELRVTQRFGDLRLDRIRKGEVQRFLNELKEAGLAGATCDHHGKLLRQTLSLAVEWGYLESNPLTGLKLFNLDNRTEVYLEGKNLQQLLEVLATDQNRMVCNIILFLLATGARREEALQATWASIDSDNKVWHVSAEVSKSRRRRSIVLNQVALDVINSLGTKGKSEYLFISSRSGERMTTISKVWDRIRRSAGLPNLRLHDLRHSYASFLANAGCNEFQIMQALGHASTVTTRRYVHLSNEAMQKAAGAASDRITEALRHDAA